MTTTLRYACHTAHLDPMTGEGLLVMPHPIDDLRLAAGGLHEADWQQVVASLDRQGWEPSESDYGGWQHARTPDIADGVLVGTAR